MKKNRKKENKICFVLYSISACLYLFTGIITIISRGINVFASISYFGLSITFGSLAYIYYKKYKA